MTLGFPPWRREALRTTLWVVPSGLLVAAVALFAVTYHVDYRVYDGATSLPSWVRIESPDGARQLLSALTAGVITCLLYTSDAADEEDSVDLGGRRIIKKK